MYSHGFLVARANANNASDALAGSSSAGAATAGTRAAALPAPIGALPSGDATGGAADGAADGRAEGAPDGGAGAGARNGRRVAPDGGAGADAEGSPAGCSDTFKADDGGAGSSLGSKMFSQRSSSPPEIWQGQAWEGPS